MIRTAIATLGILLGGVAVLWLHTDQFRAFTAEGARRLEITESPKPVPKITLTDMKGQPLTLKSENGQTTLVEFIYTTCPTICQELGESFHQIQTRLKEKQDLKNTRLISITFDLENDDPEQLQYYAKTHKADGKTWNLAKPQNKQDLKKLLQYFGIIVIPDEYGGYQHNAAIHLIDETNKLSAIFDFDNIEPVVQSLKVKE